MERVHAGFGSVPVFSDLSLSLFAGRHLALIGPNGSGKSTLLRLIQGDLRPFPNLPADAPGRVWYAFDGTEDASPLNAREHVRTVSPALQRNYVRQGWKVSGEEILLSGLDNAAMVYGELSSGHYEHAAALAAEAGASHLLGLEAPVMSQGQLRLILILRALISRPALLLLDEPFDGLDAPAREGISRCIALARQRGSTLLVSAHRRQDIPDGIHEALVLRHGAVECRALSAPKDIFETHNEIPAQRLAAVNEAASAHAEDSAFVRDILNLGPESPPLFELHCVDVFIERKRVLTGIDWSVRKGERWIVSGRNGSGKSTLLRLLYGEEFAAYGGNVHWRGKPRPGLDELRQGVGYVSDRLQDVYDYDLSAEEVVVSGLRGHIGMYEELGDAERELARAWLARLGLERLTASPFFSLSSGAMRRVLLARALASSPPVLLLDEPCSGLDASSRALFLQSLEALAANGVTLVYVSHRQEDLGPLFTHELMLEKGRVKTFGPHG